jgi:hypothetical protein
VIWSLIISNSSDLGFLRYALDIKSVRVRYIKEFDNIIYCFEKAGFVPPNPA